MVGWRAGAAVTVAGKLAVPLPQSVSVATGLFWISWPGIVSRGHLGQLGFCGNKKPPPGVGGGDGPGLWLAVG